MTAREAPAAAALPGPRSRGVRGLFLRQVVELSLLLLVVHAWAIEGPEFEQVALLVAIGFVVHHALPRAYRLPFFCALSLGAIGVVFGRDALWLVGVGLLFVGVLDLSVPHALRVGLVVLLGAGLAAMRGGWVQAPVPASVWPILGSMFMFRLVVYLYDLRHGATRPTFWQTLAYFFMLPNPCFPLFPVIDFATFRRTHYDGDPHRIYDVGLAWMLRGVIHLLLYRLVYQHFATSPSEVRDAGDFAQHALALFLLYLRVSGQFHLVVGMLHLFGFNLPETHHHYFLASSFTDFWRRINIYWKDFMLKHFFYPVYFRARRWGTTFALVAATLVVFACTWLLHSYQWFWLLGGFPLTGPDLVFWGVLAALVLANSLWEVKRDRARRSAERARSPRALALQTLRVAGTFSVICVLWSLWSSESLGDWWALVQAVASTAPSEPHARLFAIAFLPLAAVVAAIGGTESSSAGAPAKATAQRRVPAFVQGPWSRFVPLVALVALARPEVTAALGSDTAELLASLREERLNARDEQLLERGYYENLLGAQRLTSRVWEVAEMAEEPDRGLPVIETQDFLIRRLQPSVSVEFQGHRFTTNRWGMRDREYERAPTPGVRRIVIGGGSHLMGFGVGDGETFESLLEAGLAREPLRPGAPRVEILNYGVSAHSPPQAVRLLELEGLGFAPDVAAIVVHRGDNWRASRHLARTLAAAREVPYPELSRIAQAVSALPGGPLAELRTQLEPREPELLAATYRALRSICEQRGCRPLVVYLPQVGEQGRTSGSQIVIDPARSAGVPLLDLSGVYDGHPVEELWLSEGDRHPNAAGHRIVAERLHRELAARPGLIGL